MSRPPRALRSDDVVAPAGFCRWCKKPVQKPKRNWCGKECVEQYWIRSSLQHARILVKKRDRGVCARCSVDTNGSSRK